MHILGLINVKNNWIIFKTNDELLDIIQNKEIIMKNDCITKMFHKPYTFY